MFLNCKAFFLRFARFVSGSFSSLDELVRLAVCIHQYSKQSMLFRLNHATGQPLYLQLMQQIRHAVENGALQQDEQLPGIRTLAEELRVSPTTVAKAYSELEHEGLLELRQGSGAFIAVKRRGLSQMHRVHEASRQVRRLISDLRESGLQEDELRRIFEAELLYPVEVLSKR